MINYLQTMSLSAQLLTRCVGAIALCLFIAFVVVYMAVMNVLNIEMDDDLQEDILEFSGVVQEGNDDAVIAEISRETAGVDNKTVYLRLVDNNRQLIHASSGTYWDTPAWIESPDLYNLDQTTVLRTLTIDSQESEARVIVSRISSDRILIIAESLESRDEIIELLLRSFVLVFLAALPIACLVGWLAIRRATLGIASVSVSALQISEGNLDSRAVVGSQPREVQVLASSFNRMADRVNGLITDMREMTDNIAHDLRSPLGRIRAISEATLTQATTTEQFQEAAERSIAECDRLIRLINASLDVAETEAGVFNLKLETLDLAELAEEACELFDPVAEQKNIQLTKEAVSGHLVSGDRQILLRMMVNLIDNALKYTPEYGSVRVSVDGVDNKKYIDISDTGIGIPAQERSRVFDRFYRCDQSRSDDGCGLGLSFARAVARMHNGDISLRSDTGYRTVFRVSLP